MDYGQINAMRVPRLISFVLLSLFFTDSFQFGVILPTCSRSTKAACLVMSDSKANGAVSLHNVKKVAVIGAGAAGLAVANVLRIDFDVEVFEQSGDVGGVWQYTDDTEESLTRPRQFASKQKPQVHSSLYRSLRTNLPREVMQYSDFPFSAEFSPLRYPHHSAVQAYLQAFAKDNKLRQLIRFHRKVISIDTNQVGRLRKAFSQLDLPYRSRAMLSVPFQPPAPPPPALPPRRTAAPRQRGTGRCGTATLPPPPPPPARRARSTPSRCATAITPHPTSRTSRASTPSPGPW